MGYSKSFTKKIAINYPAQNFTKKYVLQKITAITK